MSEITDERRRKDMDRFDVEWELQTAVDHAVPDVKDEILKRCAQEHSSEDSVVPMNLARKPRRRKSRWQSIVAAAAILLLVFNVSGTMIRDRAEKRVETVIGLDVNPSIELSINAQDRVIDVSARNSDAYAVLSGMQLSGSSTDVAINAIIGSMYKLGYLDENSNSILVSVDSRNEAASQAIETRLVENINETLQSYSVEAAILSQTVTPTDTTVIQAAADVEMSQGRMILIQKIIDDNPVYTFDELSQLTINELNLLLNSERVEVQTITTTGTASERSYIGQEAAIETVLAQFTGDRSRLADLYADIDVMNARMVYGVTYLYEGVIYGFEVDALTGEIVANYVDYPVVDVPPTADITENPAELFENSSMTGQETQETISDSVSADQVSENEAKQNDEDGEDSETDDEDAEDHDTVSGNSAADNDEPDQDDSGTGRTGNSSDRSSEDSEEEESRDISDGESLEGKYSALFMKRSGIPGDAKLLWKEDLKNNEDRGEYDEEWITGSEARSAALSHAQVSRNDVTYTLIAVYEQKDNVYFILEFETGTAAYQYILDALTGDIVEYEKRRYDAQ